MPSPPPTVATLLDWLAARYPRAKRQTLRRMLQAGRVSVNGRLARDARQQLTRDDRVVVTDVGTAPPAGKATPTHSRLRIVFEDADVLVLDKPPGLLTSTVPREPRPTLLAAVRRHVDAAAPAQGRPSRVGLIHRLDRDASGLLVFSKNRDAYRSLKEQLFHHTVERVYTAVVEGVPTPRVGRVESRLIERADGTVYSTRRTGEGERAVTDYEVVEERRNRALVRVTLHTGRKHQIRVHLRERGAPIVGDRMYGPPTRDDNGRHEPRKAARLMLAATRLSFTHPRTGERMAFELPKPVAFADALTPVEARNRR